MIKKIISNFVLTYLEQYVTNFDYQKIKVALFKGNVALNNLEIKKDALDNVDPNIPFFIKHGVIGKLKVSIPPLTSLNKIPVVCEIFDCFLLVCPKICKKYSEEEDKKRKLKLKQNQLKLFEKMKENQKNDKNKDKEEKKKEKDLFVKLWESIINNLHITINDFIVIYEDTVNTFSRFVFHLESISAVTTDSKWRQTLITETSNVTHKLITVSNCFIYLIAYNNDINDKKKFNKFFLSKKKFENVDDFRDYVKLFLTKEQKEYILYPTNLNLKLTIQSLSSSNNNLISKNPKIECLIEFPLWKLELNDVQYKILLKIVIYMLNFSKAVDNLEFRPFNETPIKKGKNARSWWKYAYNSVLKKKRERRKLWRKIVELQKDKIKYIPIYKKHFQKNIFTGEKIKNPLNPKEQALFIEIEKKWDFQQILNFRKIAISEMKIENENQPSNNWFFKRKSIVSDDQKREIMSSLTNNNENDYSPSENNFPFKLICKGIINQGTFSLTNYVKSKENNNKKEKKRIIQLFFQQLKWDFYSRLNSFGLSFSMDDFTIFDYTNQKFKHVITRLYEQKVKKKDSKEKEKEKKKKKIEFKKSEIICFFFDKSVENKQTKYNITFSLDRVNIFINFDLLQRLYCFFNIVQVGESVSKLSKEASDQIKKVTKKATEELKLVMEKEQNSILEFFFSIKAPNVYIPLNPKDVNSKFLFFELGNIKILSTSEKKYLLQLSELQILKLEKVNIHEVINNLEEYKKTVPKHQYILEKVGVDINIEQKIKTKFEITGNLKSMNVNVSPDIIKTVLLYLIKLQDILDDPSGIYSNNDIRIEGNVLIKGKFSNEKWIDGYVRVKKYSPKIIILYDFDRSKSVILELNNKCKIKEMKSNESYNILHILFFLEDNNYYDFFIKLKNEDESKKWIKNIQHLLNNLGYKENGFIKSLVNNLTNDGNIEDDSSDIEKEEEKLENKIKKIDNEEEFFKVNVTLNSFTLNHWLNNEQLRIKFEKLEISTYILEDLYVDINIKNFKILDNDLKEFVIAKNIENNDNDNIKKEKEKEEEYFLQIQMINIIDKNSEHLFKEKAFSITKIIIKKDIEIIGDPLLMYKTMEILYIFRYNFIDVLKSRMVFSKLNKRLREPFVTKLMLNFPKKIYFQGYNVEKSLVFYTVELDKTNIDIGLNLEKMVVTGKLSNLKVKDMLVKDSKYKTIIDSATSNNKEKKDSIIEFSLTQYLNVKQGFNQIFKIKLYRIRYFFIFKILIYIFENFQQLLNLVFKEEKKLDKENENLFSLFFDVELFNPVIVLPESYQSKNQFILNCEKLKIINGRSQEDKCIYFKIDFNRINFFSIINNYKSEMSNNLNLSFFINSIFKNNEIEFKLHDNAAFKISQMQFQMFINLFNYNILKEINTLLVSPQKKNESLLLNLTKEGKNEVINLFKIQMRVKNLQFFLTNNKNIAFIECSVKGFEVLYQKFSKQKTRFEIKLHSLSLIDKLSKSEKFKKLLISKNFKDSNSDCLNFTISQTKNNEISDLKVSSIEFIFVPKIAKKVIKFFFTKTTYFLLSPKEFDSKKIKKIISNINLTKKKKKDESIKKISLKKKLIAEFGKVSLGFIENESKLLFFEISGFNFYSQLFSNICLTINFKTFIQIDNKKQIMLLDKVTILSKLEHETTNNEYHLNFEFKKPCESRLSYQDLKTIINIIQNIKSHLKITKLLKNNENVTIEEKEENKKKRKNFLSFFFNQNNDFKITTELPISFFIVDDIYGCDVPLLTISAQDFITKTEISFTKELFLTNIHFFLIINYFNFNNSEWEPIFEKGNEKLYFRILKKFNEKKLVMNFISRSVLNFNISKEMIITLSKTLKLWIKGYEKIEDQEKKKEILLIDNNETQTSQQFKPYSVLNETGSVLSFIYNQQTYFSKSGENNMVHFGTHFPFKTTHDILKLNEYIYDIKIGNFMLQKNQKILISKQQKLKLKLENNQHCCVKISSKEGRKVISFHSNIKILNSTNFSWKIGSWENIERGKKIIVLNENLKPNDYMYIPLKYIENGILTMKPIFIKKDKNEEKEVEEEKEDEKEKVEEEIFEWIFASNDKKILHFSSLFQSKKRVLIYSRNRDSKKGPLYSVLAFEEKTNHKIIKLIPPLQICNYLSYDIIFSLYSIIKKKKVDENNTATTATMEYLKRLCVISLKRGEKKEFYRINMKKDIFMKCKLSHYDIKWVCNIDKQEKSEKKQDDKKINQVLKKQNEEYHLVYSYTENTENISKFFHNYDDLQRKIKINFFYSVKNSNCHYEILLYSSYRIINKTKLKFVIKRDSSIFAGQKEDRVNKNIIFSFFEDSLLGNSIYLFFPEQKYQSKPFMIETINSDIPIEVIGKDRIFYLNLLVDFDDRNLTKILNITPLYIIANKSEKIIYFKQNNFKEIERIEIDDKLPIYWRGKTKFPEICIKIENYKWSSPFHIQVNRDIPMIIENEKNEMNFFVTHIYEERGIKFVIIENTEKPPYYVNNKTNLNIKICQYGCTFWRILEPHSKIPYSWEKISGKHCLIVEGKKERAFVNIDIVSFQTEIKKENISIKVKVEDVTRVVVIESIEINKDNNKKDKVNNKNDDDNLIRNYEEYFLATIWLKGIGFSIIDDEIPQEVMYIYFDKFLFHFSMNDREHHFDFKLKKFQINNQLKSTNFPVTIKNATKLEKDEYFLIVQFCRNYGENNFYFFPFFSIYLREVEIALDRNFANQIRKVILTFQPEKKSEKKKIESINNLQEENLQKKKEYEFEYEIKVPKKLSSKKKKIYLKVFQFQSWKFNLTYYFNEIDGPIYDDNKDNNVTTFFSLFEAFSVQFHSNIEDVKIRFPSYVLQHPYIPVDHLLLNFLNFLNKVISSEMYKIYGSFSFIGNPVGLAQDIDSGLQDLFYEPLYKLSTNPKEITKSIAKGGLSFVKHSVHGTFSSISKFSESIGNGLSYLTLDSDFVKHRQKSHFSKNRHIGEGIISGFKDLGYSFFEGTTGLFSQPLREMNKNGFSGFFKGVGKGIVGLPMKPLTGIVDMGAKITKGIKNTTTFFEKEFPKRSRLPRVFSIHGAVIPYDNFAALGQEILRTINNNNSITNEKYIHHINVFINSEKYEPDFPNVLLFSSKNLFFINKKKMSIIWKYKIESIKSLEIKRLKDDNEIILIEISIFFNQSPPARTISYTFSFFSSFFQNSEKNVIRLLLTFDTKKELNNLKEFKQKFDKYLKILQ